LFRKLHLQHGFTMFIMCYYNTYEQTYVSVLLLQQKISSISLTKKTKTNIAFKLQNLYLNSLGTYHEDLVIWKWFFSKFGKNSPVKKITAFAICMQTFSQSNKKCFIVRKACSPCPPFIWGQSAQKLGEDWGEGFPKRSQAPHHKYVSITGSCQLKFFQLPNQKNCHTKSARKQSQKWKSAYSFPTSTYTP